MSTGSPSRSFDPRDPRLLAGLFSLALVLLLTVLDLERKSPGPLTATHALVPELNGAKSCDACHGEGGILKAERSMDSACGDCHASVLADAKEQEGLHGSFSDPTDCGSCHVEHHGDRIALVSPASYAAADIPDIESFDHGRLDFTLEGRHVELDCEACHANARVQILSDGQQRFHGLSKTCASCHDDPHEGRMLPACAACHGQALPFEQVATFAHADFELDGAHAQATCLDCHEAGSPRSVEALASRPPGDLLGPKPRNCADCHSDPHSAPFLSGVAAFLELDPGQSCGTCHSSTLADFAVEPDTTTVALHGAGGFPLDGKHQQLDCSACHGGDPFAQRYGDRTPSNCEACHADPHGGQFIESGTGPESAATPSQSVPTRCVDCHTTEGFSPSTFDLAQHASSSFPLEGRHAQASCAQCHLDAQGLDLQGSTASLPLGLRIQPQSATGKTQFHGLDSACSACHLNAHKKFGDESGVAQTADGISLQNDSFASCDRCHFFDSFAETIPNAFDHQRDAGFPLDGAHATSECSACHEANDQPDESGRRFGRVSDHFEGPVDRCETCHADPHQLASTDSSFPLALSAEEKSRGCALCHNTSTFTDEQNKSFKHGIHAGFALAGAHAKAACEACHLPQSQPDRFGRAFGLIEVGPETTATSCANCHVDPHQGELGRRRGASSAPDCALCHSDRAFSPHLPGTFNHKRDTGFSLGGVHKDLSCSSCHAERDHADRLGRSFEQALGSACSACHTDPHLGQFGSGVSNDCARCHDGDGLSTRFDHDRDSAFPLDERHQALDCALCHKPAALSDGRITVRYKPLGTTCADCHGTRAGK